MKSMSFAFEKGSTTAEEDTTHDARKRYKQIRALLRLLLPKARELYRAENPTFRGLAISLSAFRDADVRRRPSTTC